MADIATKIGTVVARACRDGLKGLCYGTGAVLLSDAAAVVFHSTMRATGKVVFDEVEGGSVTRFAVLEDKTAEQGHLAPALEHHQRVVGRAPHSDGFNFANATPAQLKRYGLPQRPADSSSLAAWKEQMAKVHVVSAGQFMIGAPWLVPGGFTHRQWSGYIKSFYNQFNSSYADYIEPSTAFACNGDAVVVWAGLDGWYNASVLAQAGTAPHINSIPDHSA